MARPLKLVPKATSHRADPESSAWLLKADRLHSTFVV